jgi:hypothetical protein
MTLLLSPRSEGQRFTILDVGQDLLENVPTVRKRAVATEGKSVSADDPARYGYAEVCATNQVGGASQRGVPGSDPFGIAASDDTRLPGSLRKNVAKSGSLPRSVTVC